MGTYSSEKLIYIRNNGTLDSVSNFINTPQFFKEFVEFEVFFDSFYRIRKNLLDLQFVFVYEQTPGTVFRSKVMIAEKRIILFETKAKSGKSSLY